jgi:uncharacterized protein YcnI
MSSANPICGKPSAVVRGAHRSMGRAAICAAGATVLVIVGAAAADAHVTVHSKDAKPGGTNATLVFKVPNEEDNAKTTKIEIDLPTATPLVGIVPQAPTGWTATVTADKIVFSGGSISGDDSVEFPVKVAQLPKSNTIVFKALQTYSNGDVVRWIDQAAQGGPEPAHPAPTLNLLNPSKLSADEIADEKADSAKAKTGTAAPAAAPTAKAGTAAPTAKAGTAAPTAKASTAAPTVKASRAAPTAAANAKVGAAAPADAAKPPADAAKAAAGGAAAPDAAKTTAGVPTKVAAGGTAPAPADAAKASTGAAGAAKADPAAPPKVVPIPIHVHAGTGGQASEADGGDGTPVLPIGLVLGGFAAAGLAARRLARSH